MQNKVSFNPFSGPVIEKLIPIIQSQAEVWIACTLGGDDANRAYNESVSLILKGNLNQVALTDAIKKLVERHEALRSTFSSDGRFMVVFEEISIEPFYKDFTQLNASDKSTAVSDYLSNDAHFIFDLVKGPLLKVGLLQLSDLEHQLVITAHHIICDGWSTGIMLEELGSFYSASILGKTPEVPKPEAFYSFAEEELEFIGSEDYFKTQDYWLKQYESSVPIVSIPTDFPRPQLRTFKSNRLDFGIDYNLVSDLKKVGVQSGTSFVTTLMTAFEVFLYYQTGQDDLVLGLPAAGQSLSGKTQLVGHCVNLLPLRSKIDPNIPFNDYLKQRKVAIFDAYEYQRYSFGQLIQKLNIARDPSRVPLVPIIFNIDMGMSKAVLFDGLDFKLKSNPRAFEAFEIFLNATGSEDELILEWSYNTSLFKPSTIEQMMVTFKELLHIIIANPTIKIGDIIEIDYSAYSELNNTAASYPQLPLHELIAKQAKITPLNTALKFQNSEITYENLVRKAHQVAHYLKAQGVENGDYVAVSLPRTIDLVTTLIAIMECGAAYLPLDPSYPSLRLEFMLEDSEAKYIITNKTSLSLQTSAKPLFLEDIFSNLQTYPDTPLDVKMDMESVAYLLYTSGSTGKPKGVPITQKNLVNLLYSVLKAPGIKETDTLLSITTISFDIAMAELFAPLLAGAKLVITNEETAKDTRLLLNVMKDEKITLMQATPATWQMLLYSGWEEYLPIRAISTGEALPMVLAKSIMERVIELWNMYGPTETTIWSAMKKVSKDDEFITIGVPMANTQLYIVDEYNKLVEPGKAGELCIAGDGVAKGYWKREDLTTEKFIVNPFDTELSPVLYRSGDLAKLLPSGDVHCLGRIDQQVKIRGQRIELGEIEQTLDALNGVHSSVVLLNEDQLIAYIIASADVIHEDTNQISVWKEILKGQLPAHMIPHQFNLVKEFPKTLSGKVDRKALLQLSPNKTANISYSEPTTRSEKIIAAIWQECLNLNTIDVNSDFFEIGGHSIIGVKVMARLEKETQNRLPLVALLKHPTIKKLAAYMDSEFITWDSLVPLKPEGTKPALYLVHGANHNVLMFNELANKLDKDQPVYGLQSRGLNGVTEPHDSIDQMAADYISEIVASNPNGPYALGGFSYGGIVAYEMARQLMAQGKKVTILAQFDTYVFPPYYFTNPILKKVLMSLYLAGKVVYLIFNMFSSKKNFIRRKELLKLQVSGWFLQLKHGKEKQYEMQFNVPYKMYQNHNKATEVYTMTPQNIVIDLFRAMEEINFVHDHDLLGWKKMGQKGIRKHMVPGNHVDMFEKPNVDELAKSLQNVLDTKSIESV